MITAVLCAHADVNGDAERCPCFVPPGMTADAWELAHGHRCRVLTTQGDDAWLFAVQHANGSIDDGTVAEPAVYTFLADDGLTTSQARRLADALVHAADQLDPLIAWGT